MPASITCKHCNTPIPAENISDGELAICDVCSAINNLSNEPLVLPEKSKAKRHGNAPDKLTIHQLPDVLEIQYRWYRHRDWWWLIVSVFWGFLFCTFLFAGRVDSLLFRFSGLSFLAFAWLVAIAYALIGFLNHTTITIHQNQIQVTTRPFRFGDRIIPREDVQQIRCVQVKSDRVSSTYSETKYEYQIRFKHNDLPRNRDNLLVGGIPTLEEALFIEQEIKRLYQIDYELLQTNAFADSPLEKHKNRQSAN